MGTDKRARQKANRAAKMAAEEEIAEQEQRVETTRRFGKVAAIAAAVIAVIVLITLLTGGGDDDSATPSGLAPTPAPTSTPVVVELAATVPDDFEPFAGNRALALVEPAARDGVYDAAPAMTIDTEQTYAAVIDTSVGNIRLNLFAAEAPVAVNNFVNLAEDGFYDGLTFHNVIAGDRAEAGDPTGTGSGGAGYSITDETNATRAFDKRGVLALTNSGAGSNSSQFFITYAADASLSTANTIFGEIADDAAALDAIAEAGAGEVEINSIRILAG